MKIAKQFLLAIGLFGMLFNTAWATNDDFDFSVTAVAENVYSIISPSYGRPSPENRGWNSNSHFMVTQSGVLVFDTGSSEVIGNEIIRAIKTVTDQPVRWVVNSHSHADHWLGNAAFADAGAEVLSTNPSMLEMKKDGQAVVDAFSRMTEGATGSTKTFYPTSVLSQREKRNFGGVEVEFIFSNDGHSPGDVLMWLPKRKIIFGGDVLSSDWMPIMTHHGNIANLIDTLNTVIKLDPVTVLPGHGNVTTVKSVRRDAEFLDAVWQQVKEGHRKNKGSGDVLSQVIKNSEKDYRDLYKDFDSNIEYLVKTMMKEQIK